MSLVKLHLPFYTQKILLKIIDLMNDMTDLIVQNVDEFNESGDKLYKKIGDFIFKQDTNSKIFLLGDSGTNQLPIPWSTRIILKHKSVSNSKFKKYEKMRYESMSEKKIIDELENFAKSSSTHVCGFNKGKGKVSKYDVYRLWFETHGAKSKKYTVSNVIEYVYGSSEWEDMIKVKLWDKKVTLANINNFPHHVQRINRADLNIPVLMTMYNKEPQLLDGVHRLIKAYLTNERTIKVIMVDKKQLKKAET